MSKYDQTFTPRSLAWHFEAPDDFIGCFGWVCGFSADVGFLDGAVERFVRRTHAQRAYEGRIAIAVMLDPSNPQITPKDVPGVLHLPIYGVRPFRLLHAKVALLGFRHTSDAGQWRLRLLVSTGNWTRETLQDSLDLIWRIDLSDQDLKNCDESIVGVCADLTAAWGMLDWLRKYFDARAIQATPPGRPESDSSVAQQLVESWLRAVANVGDGIAPRFFDNRQSSFLAQLPALVRLHGSTVARNYLAMGSGFYESSDEDDKIPSVLTRIVTSLQQEQLLIRRPEIDVFVNPKACQAVASGVRAFDRAGWKVRDAGKPSYFKTASPSLHAKFLFSASSRDNSDLCNSAWLYLGSGNLTGPGFTNQMTPQSGNLEAGVVFTPAPLRWHPSQHVPPECLVTNVLPLQWDEYFADTPGALAAGNDMPEPEVQFCAPPVAYLFWVVDGPAGWLQSNETGTAAFNVIDGAGQACSYDASRGFFWVGTRPREVRVRWRTEDQEWHGLITVLDEFGRIAATALPHIDIEEAWGQLASFPMPPDDEELLSDRDAESPEGAFPDAAGATVNSSYPVRQMMQLIENIAAKQTSICQADWATWCTRLEQCLIQAAGSAVVEEFLHIQLNPLSPLRHPPFRPDFALTNDTAEGMRSEIALRRVEMAWNVDALSGIGE